MSYGGEGDGGGSGIDFATIRGRDWPGIRQFNVFLENRLGALLDVVRRFESADVRILAFTIVESADCAIVRMVLSDPERTLEIFEQAKIPITESNLLALQLPDSNQPIVRICKALLAAEISIHYAYPIMVGSHGHAALAINVEDIDTAAKHLQRLGFTLMSESDFAE